MADVAAASSTDAGTESASVSSLEEAAASSPMIRAVPLPSSPLVDGRLDDEAWRDAPATTTFHQRDPDEGMPATELTEVRFGYTASALFVAIRLWDRSPNEIVRRLSRRDSGSDADSVAVYLDPRHDHLTGFRFSVSAAGVQEDAIIFEDNLVDSGWDAVWTSQVTIDEGGWTVELGIPFSQIRFPQNDQRIWGINVARYLHRRNETSWLQLVPKAERGFVSRMAHLSGVDIDQPPSIELTPFSTVRSDLISAAPGDPFDDGSRTHAALGLDLRWGLTSNTSLTATINPDFGQAEVDPSVVNLTAFETFYPEKRPFFLEGSEIFDEFGTGTSPFYSRRIGSAPHGPASGDYVDRPTATTILGAAKIVGRTASGWNFGGLTAITGRETARIAAEDAFSRQEVEPVTSYSVARVRWDGDRWGLGGISTAVHRDLEHQQLIDVLPSRAYVGGADARVYLDQDRDWELRGDIAGSWLRGSTSAVFQQQRSSRRYYHRPDATHLQLNQDATSMNGWAGGASLFGNGGFWTGEASLSATSPGYEINDLGFQQRADEIRAFGKVVFQKLAPDRLSRYRWVSITKSTNWNFGRQMHHDVWWIGGGLTFTNYWFASASVSFQPRTVDDRLTRGGPLTSSPFRRFVSAGLGSDKRQLLSVTVNASHGIDDLGGWSTSLSSWVTVKPSNRLNLSFGPNFYDERTSIQYIATKADSVVTSTYGSRYVFADLDRTQVSLTTRADVSLTPNLSFEFYAEPFVAVGDYSGFKELAFPRTLAFVRYGAPGRGSIRLDDAAKTYRIDPGDGGASFSIRNPDFNVKSSILKSVLRWEWSPGSTLFLVWTQNRFDNASPGEFDFSRDVGAAFAAPADDVVLLKFSYRIGS